MIKPLSVFIIRAFDDSHNNNRRKKDCIALCSPSQLLAVAAFTNPMTVAIIHHPHKQFETAETHNGPNFSKQKKNKIAPRKTTYSKNVYQNKAPIPISTIYFVHTRNHLRLIKPQLKFRSLIIIWFASSSSPSFSLSIGIQLRRTQA